MTAPWSPDEIRQFLELFSAKIPKRADLWLSAWSAVSRRTTWEMSPSRLARTIAEGPDSSGDIYVAVGLTARRRARNQRARAKDVVAVPALWVDVDIKRKAAPSFDAASEALDRLTCSPSLIIYSGHGLQAWWLLDELLATETAEAKDRLVTIVDAARRAVEDAGGDWSLDHVSDLARIMRLPGTWNCKDKVPVKCRINKISDKRYSIKDLEREWKRYINQDKTNKNKKRKRKRNPGTDGGNTVITPADFPREKFAALLANDPKFAASWHRQRDDLDDDSPSGYDMAITSLAAHAGWSRQELMALLLESRRVHGDKTKHNGYYAETIARAMPIDVDAVAGDPAERKHMLAKISALLGIPGLRILDLVKYDLAEELFEMRIELGGNRSVVSLGGITTILSKMRMKTKMARATNRLIRIGKVPWDEIAEMMLATCRQEQYTETLSDRIAEIISDGISSGNDSTDDMDGDGMTGAQVYDAIAANAIVRSEDHVTMSLDVIQRIVVNAKLDVTRAQIIAALRHVGGEPIIARRKMGSSYRIRRAWKLCLEDLP